MNIYGFYGEHLDNQTEWDGLSIRSDDGLNRRWRSNTVHPFLFNSETISKGRTQIVFQLEHFMAHLNLRYFAYVFTAHALSSVHFTCPFSVDFHSILRFSVFKDSIRDSKFRPNQYRSKHK